MSVLRVWRGWTTAENADLYFDIVSTEIIPGIEARNINGFTRIDVMRRDLDDEVEFSTLMWFDSLESIKEFMGEDYAVAHVPEAAQAELKRWDQASKHYDILQQRKQ